MSDNDLIRRGDAMRIMSDGDDIVGPDYPEWFINRYATINAIPAVQPTVKPLVWVETLDGGETCLTDERYSISYWEGEKLFVDRYTTMRRHSTLEAAKAAAQADYEARILSAIDMQPTVSPKQLAAQPDDVAALVEAVIMLNAACDAMWNDHERLEENPDILGQKYRLKEIHLRAISKAQQNLPPALARVKGVM